MVQFQQLLGGGEVTLFELGDKKAVVEVGKKPQGGGEGCITDEWESPG